MGHSDSMAVTSDVTLIPGEIVTTLCVKLPKVARREQLKMLPFAVEDRILGSLDTLQYALSKTHQDQWYTAAVILKEKLSAYVSQKKSWVIPEYLYTPFIENTGTFIIQDQRVLIRLAKNLGCVCELENLAAWLEVQESLPQKIYVYGHREKFSTQDDRFIFTEIVTIPESMIFLPDINFASYTLKKAQLRGLLIAAAILVLTVVGTKIFDYVYLHKKNAQLSAVLLTFSQKILPHTKIPVTDDFIKRAYALLRDQDQHKQFFNLLHAVSSALVTLKDLQLETITFKENTMTLQFSLPSLVSLTALTTQLTQQGWQVSQKQDGVLLVQGTPHA